MNVGRHLHVIKYTAIIVDHFERLVMCPHHLSSSLVVAVRDNDLLPWIDIILKLLLLLLLLLLQLLGVVVQLAYLLLLLLLLLMLLLALLLQLMLLLAWWVLLYYYLAGVLLLLHQLLLLLLLLVLVLLLLHLLIIIRIIWVVIGVVQMELLGLSLLCAGWRHCRLLEVDRQVGDSLDLVMQARIVRLRVRPVDRLASLEIGLRECDKGHAMVIRLSLNSLLVTLLVLLLT